MKILAFLQSPGHPEGTPQDIQEQYKTDQNFHRRLLARSMSGGRLYKAFGDDLYNMIIWDNANPINHAIDADLVHMERVIKEQRPDVILAFGGVAIRGLSDLITDGKIPLNTRILHSPHPNCYGVTQAHFTKFAKDVNKMIEYWRLSNGCVQN